MRSHCSCSAYDDFDSFSFQIYLRNILKVCKSVVSGKVNQKHPQFKQCPTD